MRILRCVLVAGVVLGVVCGGVWAGKNRIETVSVFTTTAITTGSSATNSPAIDLNDYKPEGYFSLQVTATGSGTISNIVYEVSNDGTDYITPTTATAIVSSFTATSGPNGDGKTLVHFTPVIARYIRFVATCQPGGSTVNVSATLAIQ